MISVLGGVSDGAVIACPHKSARVGRGQSKTGRISMPQGLSRVGICRAVSNRFACLAFVAIFSAFLPQSAIYGDNEDCDDVLLSIPPTLYPDSPRHEVWIANGAIRAIAEKNGVIYL